MKYRDDSTEAKSRSKSRMPILITVSLLVVATIFWIRSPLPYVLHINTESFGSYWPSRGWLLGHISGATVALFLGAFQFLSGLKMSRPKLHRSMGYGYVGGIFVGGAASFVLCFRSAIPDFGFSLFFLALTWWLTAGMALIAVRHRRFDVHREWMIRGYIVTFAFVLFRLVQDTHLLDGLGRAKLSSTVWVSWVIPLLVAEVVFQWKNVTARKIVSPQNA